MNRPPSIDRLARELASSGLPHPILVHVARQAVALGTPDAAHEMAHKVARDLFGPVINATGVLLHTNLGRAPFGAERTATFTNLEFDLDTGARGSRQRLGDVVALCVGAEAAMVVNNCAGAVLLALAAIAGNGERVAVSRGELVEIGGGFRVPDVMAQSGATLVEVGTTNRTRRADYQAAASGGPLGAVLKVHQSNYRITGFTEETAVGELVGLGAPVIADIGSGLLDRNCPWLSGPPPPWLEGEPAARQTLAEGADLVTFSADKLFGGPQAGIIAGSSELVAKCRAHPLARALRPGSLVLEAVQDITLRYLNRDGQSIPFWRQATVPTDVLRQRASSLVAESSGASVVDLDAVPGGGTLPGVTIGSAGIRLRGDHLATLRQQSVPIVARVAEGDTFLDLRTVEPGDDELIGAALRHVLPGDPKP